MSEIVKYPISDIVTQLQNHEIEILADVNEPALLVKILIAAFPNDKPSFAFNLVVGDTYYAKIPRHFMAPGSKTATAWDRFHTADKKSKSAYHENMEKRAIPESKERSMIVPPRPVCLSNISKIESKKSNLKKQK